MFTIEVINILYRGFCSDENDEIVRIKTKIIEKKKEYEYLIIVFNLLTVSR